jgi:tetratricopeptide (TPR) repeat protein
MSDPAPPYKLPIRSGADRVQLDEALLEQAQGLYDRGRYLDAWEIVGPLGPLQAWSGAKAQVLGYRLGQQVGASRAAALLITRARREHPRDARVAVFYGYHLSDRGGPLAMWENAKRVGELAEPGPRERADLLAQMARVAATYRDFGTASRLLDEADSLRPGSPWLAVERAGLLQAEERNEDALAAAEAALEIQPWYRPAVQYRARLLHLLGRLDEAVAFLEAALGEIQCAGVAMQLWQFRRERDDEQGMLGLLERIEELTPEPEPDFTEWISAKRADALYLRGDLAAAAESSRRAGGPYYEAFAERLEASAAPGRRVRLPLLFVQQGHNTCGPATLAAIAAYWGGGVPQQEIVAEICYDGTHDHNEREWCGRNGFCAREFTVTWESARALLDGGAPFALATVEIDSAHLQAVVGYDETRRSLFIQDPGEPNYREVPADEFLADYALTGPRGMAVVPQDRSEILDGIDLPDGALFDLRHEFALALARYERTAAAEALGKMEGLASDHQLTRFARLSLAAFDGDAVARARCIDAFYGDFPEDDRVVRWRLQELRETGRHEERVALLRAAVERSGAHPTFLRELAAELAPDGRRFAETRRLLWAAHRRQPHDPAVVTELADLLWSRDRSPGLLDYYRFAAARSDKHEGFARSWFFASRLLRREEEALAWMRRRFEAYGGQSGGPAITLATCLDHLSRTDEALRLLDEAVARRPEDGELLLHTARLLARCGEVGKARELLERARGKCPEGRWSRAAVALHERLGERDEALSVWRGILAREPLAVDAHDALARHLAVLRGDAEALDHLAAAAGQFPHHAGLAELRLTWLRDRRPDEALEAARLLVAYNPQNAWARRELALMLRRGGRAEEGLAEAEEALAMTPREPASHGIAAALLFECGRPAEAEEALREAIRLDVNYAWAVDEFVARQHGSAARREALDFVRAEMVRQVLDGNVLHNYRSAAAPLLEPAELLSQLEEVWTARPDLWEAWSTLAAQALDAGDPDRALALAEEASGRFPLLPGAWRDLALVRRLRGEREAALVAIRRAVELNPDWETAWRIEADYLEEAGRRDEAVATLRRAVARLPDEGALRAMLAAVLWRAGEAEEAWRLAAELVVSEPGFDFAWDRLAEWADLLGRRDELVALSRRIAAERPGEARSWMILARQLPLAAVEEELEALDRAIALNPTLEDAYDHKALALARNGRFDEAEAALRRGPWQDRLPATLEGRLAWLEAVRGDNAKALARIKEVLERHRDYYWGWERCADWAETTEDRETWREAAAELMRLAPRAPEPCFRAAAATEDPEEAVRLLRRALHLDPAYAPAAGRLLSLLWRRRDLAGLEAFPGEVLDAGPTRAAALAATALATAQRGDLRAARDTLDELVAEPDYLTETSATVDAAFREDLSARARRAYEGCLEHAVKQRRIGTSFARLWTLEQVRAKRWKAWRHFGDWIERLGQRALPAILAYLDGIGDAGKAKAAVPALLRAHGDFLRSDTDAWGKAGYAMTSSGLHAESAAWLADAPARPDAEGWILANLTSSLRHLGREDEAIAVSRAVVARGLHDQTWDWHLSLAAYGATLAGNADEARELLGGIDRDALPATYEVIARMAEALCRVIEGDTPATRRSAFLREMPEMRRYLRETIRPDGRLRRTYRRTARTMAARAGAWLRWWWRPWPGEIGWFEAALLAVLFSAVVALIFWDA